MVQLPSVSPPQLYHHILAHSDVFGMHTLELRSSGKRADSSVSDICLHIDVSPQSLGPTTSPQLSKLLRDSQENYAIHIVATSDDTSPYRLQLTFFLLLVNLREQFPRLTRESSAISPSSHTMAESQRSSVMPSSPEDPIPGSSSETELYLSMKKQRIKLGLDPNVHSEVTQQLVSDEGLVREHMRGLQRHFERIMTNALHHMRRDELWKRMLYGGHRTDPAKPPTMQVYTISQSM